MQLLGSLHNKQVYYTREVTEQPPQNHLALVVAGVFQPKTHAKTLEVLVNNDPLFVYGCCTNYTDMEDVVADMICKKFPDFNDDTVMPMTFSGNDLQEAIDFCANDAFHMEKEIENIVVIDLREPGAGSADIAALLKV